MFKVAPVVIQAKVIFWVKLIPALNNSVCLNSKYYLRLFRPINDQVKLTDCLVCFYKYWLSVSYKLIPFANIQLLYIQVYITEIKY